MTKTADNRWFESFISMDNKPLNDYNCRLHAFIIINVFKFIVVDKYQPKIMKQQQQMILGHGRPKAKPNMMYDANVS